jgi:hypothetical protein
MMAVSALASLGLCWLALRSERLRPRDSADDTEPKQPARRTLPIRVGYAGAGVCMGITVSLAMVLANQSRVVAPVPAPAAPAVGADIDQLQRELSRLTDHLSATEARLRSVESPTNATGGSARQASVETSRMPATVDTLERTTPGTVATPADRPARGARGVDRERRPAAALPARPTPAERVTVTAPSAPAVARPPSSIATTVRQTETAPEAKMAPPAPPAVAMPERTTSADASAFPSIPAPQVTTPVSDTPTAEVPRPAKAAPQVTQAQDETIESSRQTDRKLGAKLREDWRQIKEGAKSGAEDFTRFLRTLRHSLSGD